MTPEELKRFHKLLVKLTSKEGLPLAEFSELSELERKYNKYNNDKRKRV